MTSTSYKRERSKNKAAPCEADNLFNLFTTCPSSSTRYKLKKAYLLRILALEASRWSQITFYIITNVLTSYFERFGLTDGFHRANIHFADGDGHFCGWRTLKCSVGGKPDITPIFCHAFKSP